MQMLSILRRKFFRKAGNKLFPAKVKTQAKKSLFLTRYALECIRNNAKHT